MATPQSVEAVLRPRRKRFCSATRDRYMLREARTPTDKAFQSSYSQGGTRRQGARDSVVERRRGAGLAARRIVTRHGARRSASH